MKKIPTLFLRDETDRRYVTTEVNPGCQWVIDGEGVATRKYDGTCVMLDSVGKWWARREVKPGKNPPENYILLSVDENTNKAIGWEPIEQSSFANFHEEALSHGRTYLPGTYELIGPKINGNPEKTPEHFLVSHEFAQTIGTTGVPRTPEAIVKLVKILADDIWGNWEGLVWHHPDGRMAKIKARDIR